MHEALSIKVWHQLALDGNAPPVRIQLNGCSMDPLIRKNRDNVTIIPPEDEMKTGNIVLFCEPEKDRYVVHRIWKIQDGKVLTWGDNCPEPDAWIPMESIWGKVVLIERGKRRIKPHPKTGLIWAFLWHQAMKIYRVRGRIKRYLGYKNQQ
ncbi:MAG: hypothetical protein K6A68_07920 [Clostridiales bacterium]|nr:hypothetical protein [Clostridiales bacterium]